MANLYWLDQIQPEQRPWVGNKAYHLSRLLQIGYPVVPGFVIGADMLRDFWETIDWLEPLFADLPYSSLHLDIQNSRQLLSIAQQIRRTIQASPLPDEWLQALQVTVEQLHAPVVTLRPSLAVQSEGGSRPDPIAHGKSSALFNSQVCSANMDDLAEGLKRLWADLFGAKSLFYWQRSGIPLRHINLAVLVQPVWSAIAAGTVQTSDHTFVVKSTVGLGMAIDRGEILPDTYQVDTLSGIVQSYQAGKRAIAYRLAQTDSATDAARIHASSDDVNAATGNLARAAMPAPATRSQAFPTLLQTVVLSEAEQNQDALDQTQLGLLIHLTQRLAATYRHTVELEWTLSAIDGNEPQFYFTQVIPQGTSVVEANHQTPTTVEQSEATLSQGDRSQAEQPSMLLLQGLAASPGRAIAKAIVLTAETLIETMVPGTVLVIDSLPLHCLSLIKQAAAIITEQGGMTSHSAILAREFGIPAVMGATDATRLIQTGDLILVDGRQGNVFCIADRATDRLSPAPTNLSATTPLGVLTGLVERSPTSSSSPLLFAPTPATQLLGQQRLASATPGTPVPAPKREKPTPLIHPPIGTQLMVSLSQPESLAQIADAPIDGIGLLRSELLMLSLLGNQHPEHWLHSGQAEALVQRLSDQIIAFALALAPRPVFYRSMDLRSHEFRRLLGGDRVAAEANPVLGLRGAFSYTLNPALFDLELAALARVQQLGYLNVHLMLPFVRTVEEFRFCRQRIEQAGLTHNPQFQLWIMAEVPSVLFLLPDYVKAGVQGISIGSNDLTQLLLGVDRDHSAMATAFDERHSAVQAAIAQLIQQATQLNLPCSICGQATAQYPEFIENLVRWGITSISVPPEAVESTYWAIVRAERRLLLETSRQE